MFKRIIWVLNILAVAGLILAFMAAWISPESCWWLALFGLGFEILFVVNVLFIIYWLISRNKNFILSLILVLLGIGKILAIVQLNFGSEEEKKLKDDGYIKVMTFNVRLFDLYNWFHNSETKK